MKKTLSLIFIFLIVIFNCRSGGDLSSNAQKAKIYFEKGFNLINESKFDDAIKNLEMSIKLDPSGNCGTGDDGSAYNELGYIFYLTSDYDKALDYYNQCLKINPAHKHGLLNRCNIFMLKKNWDRCLEDINNLLKLVKDDIMVHFQRGNIYEQMKVYDKSLIDYEFFLQKSEQYDNNPTIHKLRETAKEAVNKIKNKTTD